MSHPDGPMRWIIRLYLAVFLLYLLFPMVYMLLVAFNESRIPTHRDFSFTLQWFVSPGTTSACGTACASAC